MGMRKILRLCVVALFVFSAVCAVFSSGEIAYADTQDGKYVRLGGYPIGIAVKTDGLIVVDVGAVATENGEVFPLEKFSLAKGDVIVEIQGEKADSIYKLKRAVENSDGEVELVVRRKGGNVEKISVEPALDKLSDEKKIGLVAKEDVGGVGTMTFITENGRYGALGHHVLDVETNTCEELQSGNIFSTSVTDVIKGTKSQAGGLVASLNRLETPIGNIEKNTDIGIYGEYYDEPVGDMIRIAEKGEVKIGKAQIFTTVSGTEPKLYDVDIVKVVSQSGASEKGLVLSVRDSELIEKTGGIVQGMSGSPIIQNGLLVGAVTHVFIGDATRGYGVHSRFMYDYAQEAPAVKNELNQEVETPYAA